MDERLRFVARLLEGEKMAVLCREFDISRKTGYKIFERYKDYGVHGLTDRSRRPFRHANKLPAAVERLILRIKREHPSWGAPKVRESFGAAKAIFNSRLSAPCTLCSIATGSSAAAANVVTRPKALHYPSR